MIPTTTTSSRIQKWSTLDNHSPMVALFNNIHPISQAAIDYLDASSYPVSMSKGKFLLKAGQIPDRLYLLTKGVVRGFIKDENKEITTWITGENELVSSIRGLGLPPIVSEENIQVIEPAQLVGLEYKHIDYMYKHFPESNIVARIMLEEIYRAAEERAYISRIPSAEKKYKRFIETKPKLVNQISLKYIASYLSMTQETLSRIRTREAKKEAE